MNFSPSTLAMIEAARRAGSVLQGYAADLSDLTVETKGTADFVSVADREAEAAVYGLLSTRFPHARFVMEESGEVGDEGASHAFHVDPLDGTTNFLHGLPLYAVSIGLVVDGVPESGVVYNPATDEMFVAQRGRGAWLGERRLSVSPRVSPSDSVVAIGTPAMGKTDVHAAFLAKYARVMRSVGGIRRLGAASLDIAYVAAGAFEAYWERGLKSWDMAAGLVLVSEAGGVYSDDSGGQDMFTSRSVCLGNPSVQKVLLELVKD